MNTKVIAKKVNVSPIKKKLKELDVGDAFLWDETDPSLKIKVENGWLWFNRVDACIFQTTTCDSRLKDDPVVVVRNVEIKYSL